MTIDHNSRHSVHPSTQTETDRERENMTWMANGVSEWVRGYEVKIIMIKVWYSTWIERYIFTWDYLYTTKMRFPLTHNPQLRGREGRMEGEETQAGGWGERVEMLMKRRTFQLWIEQHHQTVMEGRDDENIHPNQQQYLLLSSHHYSWGISLSYFTHDVSCERCSLWVTYERDIPKYIHRIIRGDIDVDWGNISKLTRVREGIMTHEGRGREWEGSISGPRCPMNPNPVTSVTPFAPNSWKGGGEREIGWEGELMRERVGYFHQYDSRWMGRGVEFNESIYHKDTYSQIKNNSPLLSSIFMGIFSHIPLTMNTSHKRYHGEIWEISP